MNLPTVASINVRPEGLAEVEAALRISAESYIRCHRYDGKPPIMSLTDQHVHVSISVPDSDRVTADDLDTARRLAKVVAEYIAELEARAAAQDDAAAVEGVAA
jgi:hypothetical protein